MSCRDVIDLDVFSKSDVFIVVYVKDKASEPWAEKMRTGTIWDNLNPDFTEQVVMDYHFELVQEIKFEAYDRDSDSQNLRDHDFIGSVSTTLSKIMGSRGATFSAELVKPGSTGKRGRLIVRGEEINTCKDIAHFSLSAKNLDRKDGFGIFGRSDPFYSFFRSREDGSFVKVFESEVIKRELNPKWKPIHVPVQIICNGDIDRPIKIQVSDWNSNGSHELIGENTTSLRALQSGKEFLLSHPHIAKKKGSKYKGSGTFIVNSARIEKRHSFLDYIRGGCELNLIVAIDFTASNGAPSTPQSLHFQHPTANGTNLNEYQKAILSIGEILQDYDSDQKFPVYGFGGQINGETNHCFPLTFDPANPEVSGISGIMDAYKNAFQYVRLSGPTLFSRILGMANTYAQQQCSQQSQAYTIMLILTDGVINDMDMTIQQIVAGSKLPLSIVIVGVGNADFSNMEVLDADDEPLRYGGETMQRDIVQFVPFRKFHRQHYSALAAETLEEIPEQLVSYMTARNIVPNAPTAASVRHIEQMQRQSTQNVLQPGLNGSDGVPVAIAVPSAPPAAPPVRF